MTTIYGPMQAHIGHALEVERWHSGELAIICLDCNSDIIMDFEPEMLRAVVPCSNCERALTRRIAVLIEPCEVCGEITTGEPMVAPEVPNGRGE